MWFLLCLRPSCFHLHLVPGGRTQSELLSTFWDGPIAVQVRLCPYDTLQDFAQCHPVLSPLSHLLFSHGNYCPTPMHFTSSFMALKSLIPSSLNRTSARLVNFFILSDITVSQDLLQSDCFLLIFKYLFLLF